MVTEIKITRTVKVEESVQVDFPLHFKSEWVSDSSPASSDSHYRVAADGATVEVTTTYEGGEIEKYEIEVTTTSQWELGSMLSSPDYFRPSTPNEFETALSEARRALDKALQP